MLARSFIAGGMGVTFCGSLFQACPFWSCVLLPNCHVGPFLESFLASSKARFRVSPPIGCLEIASQRNLGFAPQEQGQQSPGRMSAALTDYSVSFKDAMLLIVIVILLVIVIVIMITANSHSNNKNNGNSKVTS